MTVDEIRSLLLAGLGPYTILEPTRAMAKYDATWKCERAGIHWIDCPTNTKEMWVDKDVDWCRSCKARAWLAEHEESEVGV